MTEVKFYPPKGTVELEAEISIIVPSTKGVKEQKVITRDEMNKRVDDVRKFLSRKFKGYTSVKAVGGYLMRKKNGGLVKEDVVVVTAFTNKMKAKGSQNILINKIQNLCLEWQQETVSLIFETNLFLISRKKK